MQPVVPQLDLTNFTSDNTRVPHTILVAFLSYISMWTAYKRRQGIISARLLETIAPPGLSMVQIHQCRCNWTMGPFQVFLQVSPPSSVLLWWPRSLRPLTWYLNEVTSRFAPEASISKWAFSNVTALLLDSFKIMSYNKSRHTVFRNDNWFHLHLVQLGVPKSTSES